MTCTQEAVTPATIASNNKDNKDDDNNDNVKKHLVLLARHQPCHASCFLVYFFDVHCTTMT